MAKVISDEQMRFDIVINGDDAQKELYDLEKATRAYKAQNKELGVEKAKLEKQNKKSSAEYKLLTSIMKDNNDAIAANKTRMSELQNQLGLTSLSTGQLSSKASELKANLRNLVPGSAEYIKYKAELDQVNNRMRELSGRAITTRGSLSSMADGFNRFQGMAFAAVATLTGVVVSVQKIIDINGKLSDAQSDVMKTTQMTKKEVDELTKSFGLLETRTSRIDLLKIAEEGGRVGILKEDIGDFVDVMNKAAVALGDSFTGGAEEVAAKLGKIKFLFQETKDLGIDKAYNSIGSAINDLGADGVASERNIAEFTTRIGSLTDVLKPTIQETLALGAAFEESGIEAEISSRAYGIFMNRAATESAKFAEVMGISKQAVEDMINTNPLDFMLKFAEGMKGMNATDVAKTLDYLKINADGANKVIGAMGNNTARFRQQIDLSNKSFAEGTSLINEYDIKNNNLAATLEKINKKVTGWFSSETFTKYLLSLLDWFAQLIGAVEDSGNKLETWQKILLFGAKIVGVVIAGLISYSAAIRFVMISTKGAAAASSLLAVVTRAKGIAFAATRGILIIYTAVMNSFGIATKKATAEVARLNLVTKLSPWGALLAVVSAVVVAYMAFRKSADDAAGAQGRMNASLEVQSEYIKNLSQSTNDLKSKVEPLIAVLNDENTSLETRKTAYSKLIEISPAFIDTVDAEFRATNKLTDAYDKLIKKLDQKALAAARESVRARRAQALADAEANEYEAKLKADAEKRENDAIRKRNAAKSDAYKNKLSTSTREESGLDLNLGDYSSDAADEYSEAQTATSRARGAMLGYSKYQSDLIAKLQAELKKQVAGSEEALRIQDEINAILGSFGDDSPIVPSTSTYTVPGGGNGSSKSKKYDDSYLTEEQRLRDALYKIRQKSEKERIDLMEEGWEKQMALERFNHEAILQETVFQEENLKALMIKTQSELRLAEKAGDDKKVDSLKNQQNLILEQEQELNEQRENEKLFSIRRIAILEEKAAKDLIDKEDALNERRKIIRETDLLNYIESLGISESEKQKIREDAAYLELEYEKDQLNNKLNQLKQILAGEVINGIDFNLLTPEAKDKIQQDVELVENAIAKLLAAKDNPEGGKELDLGMGGKADMLGFTPDQWKMFFTNVDQGTIGVQTMAMAAMAVVNAFGELDKAFSAQENRRLKQTERNADREKKTLKRSLDSGLINQVQYKKAIEKVDIDLDKKKSEIEYKQAKRQKAMAVANIIMNTAQAIIGIWAQFPKMDFGVTAGIMSGVVGALGALQLSTVLAAPLPAKGYEQGLYPEYVKREQDGKVFKSRFGGKTRSGLVKDTSHFIVAENGPEMVIDNNAWRQLDPNVKQALLDDLRGIKGFEKGKYSPEVTTSGSAAAAPANNDEMMMQMMSTMKMTNELLKFLIDNGLLAKIYTSDERAMADLKKGIDKAEARRKSNKL